MKIKIGRKDIEDARNRMALILAHMDKIDPSIALNYFATLNILSKLLNDGEVKFDEDDCVYIMIKEDKDARREKPVAGEVPGHISGTDTEDKGVEDRQKEVAPDSAD